MRYLFTVCECMHELFSCWSYRNTISYSFGWAIFFAIVLGPCVSHLTSENSNKNNQLCLSLMWPLTRLVAQSQRLPRRSCTGTLFQLALCDDSKYRKSFSLHNQRHIHWTRRWFEYINSINISIADLFFREKFNEIYRLFWIFITQTKSIDPKVDIV